MEDRPVHRCVCHDVSFADLVRLQRETGEGFDALQRRTHAGTGCGLCRPYILAALATGETRFPVLPEPVLREIAAAAKKKGPASLDAGPGFDRR